MREFLYLLASYPVKFFRNSPQNMVLFRQIITNIAATHDLGMCVVGGRVLDSAGGPSYVGMLTEAGQGILAPPCAALACCYSNTDPQSHRQSHVLVLN